MSTSTDAPIAVPKPERPPPGARMPSLNQLAARINLNNNAPSSSSSIRPRLAATLLRTGSQASMTSAATSVADSTAVQAPYSRSTSPTTLSTSPPHSSSATPPASEKGELLTTENLEELDKENEEEAEEKKIEEGGAAKAGEPAKKNKYPVGYKNIPSLDAITKRLTAKARTLSVDGTSKPPEAETIEDPKTPGLRIKAPEHPLEHPWYVPIASMCVVTKLIWWQDNLP